MRSPTYSIFTFITFALALLASGARAAEPNSSSVIAKAYEYGFPIFEQARLCYNFSYSATNPRRVPVNHFGHRRTPADATRRVATTPNTDTFYSSAVLDLSYGPVELKVPAFGKRYFTIAFLDAYTNNFAHIGTQTGVIGGATYLIVGPGWKGLPPEHVSLIHAPSRHVIALGRIYVSGPSDYEAVHRLQDKMILTPLKEAHEREGMVRPIPGDAENFVAVVNQVIHDDPPPKADDALLRQLAIVGIGKNAASMTDQQKQTWRRHFPLARAALIAESREVGRKIDGWEYTPADIGNFGTDYKTRAVMALRGIWANTPAELLYTYTSSDRYGMPLDARGSYRLHLPRGAPPVKEFWSLSMYEAVETGELYFGDNSIHRYAISSSSPNLIWNRDGSLDILIQRNRPTKENIGNWLPIPSEHFELVMRAYLPDSSLLSGNFRYPGIERLN